MTHIKNNTVLVLIFFSLSISLSGQEESYNDQTRFIQKSNPSFFGVNQLNKTGVLYNSSKINNSVTMDNKYFFGSISFTDKKFSLGVDVNSFSLSNNGLVQNLMSLSYIYVIQLDSDVFFLPSVSAGMGTSKLNNDNLIFEDQLNTQTGFINTETIDPLASIISNSNYLDLGASFLIHSENYIFGLSLKHINKPNVSFNKEIESQKPLRISLQSGYEFNINPYENSWLPRYSFLFVYGNFSKFGDAIFINMAQNFHLGEFSVGLVQKASSVNSFSLNNIGLTMGLSLENFDFGMNYNFPIRNINTVYSPSIFELSVIFDFSIYRRNNRGLYKTLQIDNYY
jgi:type IX secretion system PorP/SprF family membrane protein